MLIVQSTCIYTQARSITNMHNTKKNHRISSSEFQQPKLGWNSTDFQLWTDQLKISNANELSFGWISTRIQLLNFSWASTMYANEPLENFTCKWVDFQLTGVESQLNQMISEQILVQTIPRSVHTCVPNLVMARRSCQKGVLTHRQTHTQRDTAALFSRFNNIL